MKQNLPLWLPYASLSGWLMCFMRVCFRSVEQTKLVDRENTLFIVLCAGIILGMLVPLPDLHGSWRRNQAVFRMCAIAAIPCTVMAVNTQGAAALVLTLLTSFFASAALGCSLYRISLQLNRRSFGLFFGAAFSASEGLLFMVLLLRFDRFQAAAEISALGLCLLLLIAAITYRDSKPPAAYGEEEPDQDAPPPSKDLMRKYLLALLLYCVMGGLLDNLTSFDDAFFGVPYLLELVYLFSVAANLVLGALFHRFDWRRLAMAGILLICVGQSLPYFSSVSALAVPYLALTTLGIIIIEFIVRSLPTQYAHGARRKAMVARVGYASLYGGFLVTSILFEYLPRGRYFFVMGIVLMLAFAILSLLYTASGEEERTRYERMMANLRKLPAQNSRGMNTDFTAAFDQYNLTARERDVCAMLLSAHSLKQIAVDLHIAYGTANKHYTNLYRKLDINSRAELFQKFGVKIEEMQEV